MEILMWTTITHSISLNFPFEGRSPQGGGCVHVKGKQPSAGELVNAIEKTLTSKQPVAISPANPIHTTKLSPIGGSPFRGAGGKNMTTSKQSVAISPANANSCINPHSPLEGGSPQGGGCVYIKGEQPVANSPANPIHTTKLSPIKAVISHGAKRSEAKREISRTYATSYTTALQEISHGVPNDDAIKHAKQPQNHEQFVAISPANPIRPTTPSPIKAVISHGAKRSEAKREISRTYATSYTTALQEIFRGAQNEEAVKHAKQPQNHEQPVAISPANPIHATKLSPIKAGQSLIGGSPFRGSGGKSTTTSKQPVANSPASPIQTTKLSPIKAVISHGAKRSEAKREISRTYATSYITALQEIFRGAQNEEAVKHAKQPQNHEQPVAISPANPIHTTKLSPIGGSPFRGAGGKNMTTSKQSVAISPANANSCISLNPP